LIQHGPGRSLILVEEILKHYPVALEAVGINVGDVVGNGAHLGIFRRQAGFTDP